MMFAMQHVRLMTWCPNAVSAMHLPAFAAAEGGLFAERDLEVEFVPAAGLEAVAAGGADCALTGVFHLLATQARAAGRLPVRFIATAHQRNAIVGVVREDSGLRTPQELPGARLARWSMPWYADEYVGALGHLGLAAPPVVDTPGGLDEALGSGSIDVLPMWMEDTTPACRQGMTLHHRGERFGVRAIALDIPVYSAGLVAADRLPAQLTARLRDAFVAGYALQRDQPDVGLAGFRRCFPDVSPAHAQANWDLFAPYAFDGVPAGSMDAGRWQQTITHTAKAHGLPASAPERVYRPELLAHPAAHASA